jgi:protein-disulfide isomerase
MHAKCLFAGLLLTACAVAQQNESTPAKPASPAAHKAAASATAGLPSDEAVNGFMQATFGYEPEVSWKVADIRPSKAQGLAQVTVILTTPQGQQQQQFYVSPDGSHAVVGEIIPFGPHPFAPARKELEARAKGPARGPADAAVTIVEFSDMQCPHCKAAQPVLEKLLTEEPKVKLIYQNFPLPMHDWAAKGAAYSECVGGRSKEGFWKFVQSVYDAQSDITASSADEKLTALADQAGVKGSEIAACAAEDVTVGRVQGSYALGQSLEVNSTPTLFINGRRIADVGNVPYDVLKRLVEFAAKGGM